MRINVELLRLQSAGFYQVAFPKYRNEMLNSFCLCKIKKKPLSLGNTNIGIVAMIKKVYILVVVKTRRSILGPAGMTLILSAH